MIVPEILVPDQYVKDTVCQWCSSAKPGVGLQDLPKCFWTMSSRDAITSWKMRLHNDWTLSTLETENLTCLSVLCLNPAEEEVRSFFSPAGLGHKRCSFCWCTVGSRSMDNTKLQPELRQKNGLRRVNLKRWTLKKSQSCHWALKTSKLHKNLLHRLYSGSTRDVCRQQSHSTRFTDAVWDWKDDCDDEGDLQVSSSQVQLWHQHGPSLNPQIEPVVYSSFTDAQ